ncbi:MAG: hypothetical protein WCO09_04710, partial [bacterium]
MRKKTKLTSNQKFDKMSKGIKRDILNIYRENIHILLEAGEITLSDFDKDGCLHEKFFLIKRPNDYRSSILEQARLFKRKRQYDFSMVFYAIYTEHFFNRIIYLFGMRNRLSEDKIIKMIRSYNFEPKLTKALELFKLPKL